MAKTIVVGNFAFSDDVFHSAGLYLHDPRPRPAPTEENPEPEPLKPLPKPEGRLVLQLYLKGDSSRALTQEAPGGTKLTQANSDELKLISFVGDTRKETIELYLGILKQRGVEAELITKTGKSLNTEFKPLETGDM